MYSFIKGGMQVKDIRKYPDENIWIQEGCEWGVEQAPKRGTS